MRNIAHTLLLLLCATHGRRVPPLAERRNGQSSTNDVSDLTKSLATALLALNPATAFMPSAVGRSVHVSTSTAGRAASRYPLLDQQSRVATHAPKMHNFQTLKELAAKCLEQGCPVDAVEELLTALKAEEDPKAELFDTYALLEKLLVEPKTNKHAIEKLVAAVASSHTMRGENIGIFSEMLSRTSRAFAPKMHHIEGESHELTPKELAAKCLEQGCPVDTVEELLAALKAEENPSAELTGTINELEKLLVEPKANKNAIEKLVAAVANRYTMPGEVIGAFSEALSRASRSSAPKMHHIEGESHELTPKELAAKCLEQGCPVDTVEELLVALKAEENPSAELTATISDLQGLLVAPKTNKNAIEKLVAAVANRYTMLGEVIGAFSEAKLRRVEGVDHEFTPDYSDAAVQELLYPSRGHTELDEAKMKVSSSSVDLADMCLQEGCPTNLVVDLVMDLKKTKKPTAELTKTIKELENLLAQDNAKKNHVKKLILSMARDFESFDKKLFGATYP